MSAGTFMRAAPSVAEMAKGILAEYPVHKPLVETGTTFDFVFAFAKEDEKGNRVGHAIYRRGVRALVYCRIVDLKDRALGHADAEITLDGDWWRENGADRLRALLDHELTHVEVQADKFGSFRFDDLKRPKLRLRPHDYEFGWFTQIAARHGAASQERIQAQTIMDASGQFYWPDVCKPTDTQSEPVKTTIIFEGKEMPMPSRP